MQPAITTLDREIAREERIVGIRPNGPITPAHISRRQYQVALVQALVIIGMLGVMFGPGGDAAASPLVRTLTVVFAMLFVAYGVEQDRHLRRLATLTRDSRAITLAVADAISHSGALGVDTRLLTMRDVFERAAPALAAELAEVLPGEAARVRVAGPSGELPVAALRATSADPVDDPVVARHALRRARPVQRADASGGVVLAVPVWFDGEPVGVFEVVSAPDSPFEPRDAALVDAFAKGAVAALRASL